MAKDVHKRDPNTSENHMSGSIEVSVEIVYSPAVKLVLRQPITKGA
jgi:hypothetical protein